MSPLEAIFDVNFEAYLHGPAALVVLAGFGLIVGVLTGLFGVGGAFLITPLLNVGLGVPYQQAIGSGLCFTIGTSCSGMRRHVRTANFDPRCMLILAGASIVGAVMGATLNRSLNIALGKHSYTLMMHSLFVVVLGTTGWMVARSNREHPSGKSLLQRLPLPPYVDLPVAGLVRVSLPGICAVGIGIGVMKGMMGIGGGVLFMPLLILVVGLTPHQAVGTSLGVVMFSSIAGTLKYGLDGNVNLLIAMALLVSSVFGVQIGAWICNRLQAQRLRRYFAVLVVLAALGVAGKLLYQLLKGGGAGGL